MYANEDQERKRDTQMHKLIRLKLLHMNAFHAGIPNERHPTELVGGGAAIIIIRIMFHEFAIHPLR